MTETPAAMVLAWSVVSDVVLTEQDGPVLGSAKAGDRLDQLALPVAGNTGDSNDLALSHFERDTANGLELAIVVHTQISDLEHRRPSGRRLLVDAQHDLSADHHLGKAGLVGLGGPRLAHQPARSHRNDPVREGHDLVEFVGDDHDGQALVDELANDLEELADFLRGQNGGRLVEDEDPGLAKERLEYLDPLLHSHREIHHARIGVDLQAVALRDIQNLFARTIALDDAELRGFETQARCSR